MKNNFISGQNIRIYNDINATTRGTSKTEMFSSNWLFNCVCVFIIVLIYFKIENLCLPNQLLRIEIEQKLKLTGNICVN